MGPAGNLRERGQPDRRRGACGGGSLGRWGDAPPSGRAAPRWVAAADRAASAFATAFNERLHENMSKIGAAFGEMTAELRVEPHPAQPDFKAMLFGPSSRATELPKGDRPDEPIVGDD